MKPYDPNARLLQVALWIAAVMALLSFAVIVARNL